MVAVPAKECVDPFAVDGEPLGVISISRAWQMDAPKNTTDSAKKAMCFIQQRPMRF
jgi:hypothetical protein